MSETAKPKDLHHPMVERVARAIATAVSGVEISEDGWAAAEIECPEDAENFRVAARTAIAAMREPTDAMTEAGWPHTADPCWQKDVGHAWRAMIDAALAPSPTTQTEE